MAIYPLTELGYVAKEFISRHIITFVQLGENVTAATGIEIKKNTFQHARRSDRGLEVLRNTVMDYMREQDPELVERSLETYKEQYQQRGA